MLFRIAFYIFLPAVILTGAVASHAQVLPSREPEEDRPKSFKETLVKLRIDQEKKDFDEMIERGQKALKLSEELEKAYAINGRLNPNEITKLSTVEKLVKKIRNDLGGDDDEGSEEKSMAATPPLAQGEAVKSFRSTTLKLFQELKKTTRFTVSAAAIQASNAVLKLARFLRISLVSLSFSMKLSLLFLSAILTFSCLQSNIFSQTDDDVISVDSSIVVMNATITDASGKAVGGLGQKLFKVFEDGREQEIVSFSAEETPFAAVILLDTSGSMENRVTLARSAAIQFLSGLRADDSVAIYNFDSKVAMVLDFSNTRDIRDQIFELKASGMTVLNDAIFRAAELLAKRAEKRRAIVVLSDGADTMSGKSADKALQAASLAGATIYTVDMSAMDDSSRGRMQNQGVLKNFSEKTGGKFMATPGGVAMRDGFKRIVEELGVQYTVAFHPANTTKDGKWRSLELRVARPGLTIRTRKGYKATTSKTR